MALRVAGHFSSLESTILRHYKNLLDLTPVLNSLAIILNKYKKASELVVASVGNIPKEAFSEFESQVNIHFISSNFTFTFNNNYSTPNTLGIDRMVLANGAVLKYPKQNRLVIDAGTCITYDFI